MTTKHRILAVIATLVIALLCAAFPVALAEEVSAVGSFPEGTIEVPQGTEIYIDDTNDTVTIIDNPIEINDGDTFVVYLQDLPIGYVAKSVKVQDSETIISVEKADKSLYAMLDEVGVIELTPDMYEFIPAENVIYEKTVSSDLTIGGDDGLSYNDGKLILTKSFGGNTAKITLSSLRLVHSTFNGDMSLSLQGNWEISTPELSTSEDILDDVPLGEVRIAGIGKISIKMSISMDLSMTCNFSGTFSVGFSTSDDEAGSVTSSFSCSEKVVSGKGKIDAELKITAGVDILIAAADLYGEIGVATEVDTKFTTNQSTHETTSCANYRTYIFLKAGVEAKFFSPISGKMKPLASQKFDIPDEIATPFSVDIHFENGQLVNSCTQGMSIPIRQFGGYTTNFGSTVLTDPRERILESDVSLPWNVVVDEDLFISNGNLDLNGYTLTIEGDLIQSGGTITIGLGNLVVIGDYRLQSYDRENNAYGISTGNIVMSNPEGQINVFGDFIIQSESDNDTLTHGTINIEGDLIQKNASAVTRNLYASTNCHITMTAGKTHSILMDSPNDNTLGTLVILGNTTIPYSMHLEGLDIIDSNLTVIGDLIQNCGILYVHSGKLKVSDNLCLSGGVFDIGEGICVIGESVYHSDGTLNVNAGTISIQQNYYNVGESSVIDDSCQEIKSSRGILQMVSDGGEMIVGATFITYSNYNHGGSLTDGTLYVAGDFYQIGTGAGNNAYTRSGSNFRANSSHTTVLNGSGRQIIKFDSSDSYFGTFEATNTDIVFEGCFRWLMLGSDVEAGTNGAWPNYYNINHDPITLNGHKLTIHDDLLHSQGTISIDGGELHVTDDYYIVGSDSIFNNGEEGLEACQGVLSMTNPEDIVRVDGMFLTKSSVDHRFYLEEGTLYVGGDFRQIGVGMGNNAYSSSWGANFRAQPEHTTVLNGSGRQAIRFDSSYSYFGILKISNDLESYDFNPNPCWTTIVQLDIPRFGDPEFILPSTIAVIEESSFEGIAAHIVYIPDTCTNIGSYAFRNSSVAQIRIPDNCVLGEDVFAECDEVVIFGTTGSDAENYCNRHDNCMFVEER